LQKSLLNWDENSEDLAEDLTEFTNVIISEVDRLRDLVDKLLGPSRLPQKQQVNIHEVLEYVRHLVMAEGFPNIQVVTDYDPSIPELSLDRNQMIQVILNLIKNALQALNSAQSLSQTPSTQVTSVGATLTLKTRTVAQYTIGTHRSPLVLKVDILDNGPGIPAHIQETVFFPMVSGRPEGIGLGLAIAQSIVNQHNGIIEFESQEGLTRFSILLPMEHGS
jgi:two-component system nitrogen regulation sensor histidine kinase GlnL